MCHDTCMLHVICASPSQEQWSQHLMQLTLHIEQIASLTTVRSRICYNGWRMACFQRTAGRRSNTCATSWLKAQRCC